jgi:hypothetical protein
MSGFSAQNLWRMRQFFDTYRDQPKLSPLVRDLSWTNNLLILARCKRPEEREFKRKDTQCSGRRSQACTCRRSLFASPA